MEAKQILEDVFHGEEVDGITYNAFGYTLAVAGKTITGLTLEEAEEVLNSAACAIADDILQTELGV